MELCYYDSADIRSAATSSETTLFRLNALPFLPRQCNHPSTGQSLRHILSLGDDDLIYSVQFTYEIDIPWLIQQYPFRFKSTPLLIVTGQHEAELRGQLTGLPSELFAHIRFAQAPNIGQYGTHHTKMMLLFYTTGMRVVVSTANLVHCDWELKTQVCQPYHFIWEHDMTSNQGVWVSPLFPRRDPFVEDIASPAAPPRAATEFARDLWDYLYSYGAVMQKVLQRLAAHDMSEANVRIVASIPGTHHKLQLEVSYCDHNSNAASNIDILGMGPHETATIAERERRRIRP